MTTLARTSRGLETNASHAELGVQPRDTMRSMRKPSRFPSSPVRSGVMQNIKSLAFREDDDEIYDGIETIRRVYPERVFDSESGE